MTDSVNTKSKIQKRIIANAIFCSVVLLTSSIVVIPYQIAEAHSSPWHAFCFDQTMTAFDWLPDVVGWLGPWWKLLAGIIAIGLGMLLSLACPPHLAPPPDYISSLSCDTYRAYVVDTKRKKFQIENKFAGQAQVIEDRIVWFQKGFSGITTIKNQGGVEKLTLIENVAKLPKQTKGVSTFAFPVVGSSITYVGNEPLNVIYRVNNILVWADAQGGLWIEVISLVPGAGPRLLKSLGIIGFFLDFLFGIFGYDTLIAQSDPTAGTIAHPMGFNLKLDVERKSFFNLGANILSYRTTNTEFTRDTAVYRFNVYDIDEPTIDFEDQTRKVEANAHWGFKLNADTIPKLGRVTPLDGCDPFPQLTPPVNDFYYLTSILEKPENATWKVTEHTYYGWQTDSTVNSQGPIQFSGQDAINALIIDIQHETEKNALFKSFASKFPTSLGGDPANPSVGKASVVRTFAIDPIFKGLPEGLGNKQGLKSKTISHLLGIKDMNKALKQIDVEIKLCKKKVCSAATTTKLADLKKGYEGDIDKIKGTKKGGAIIFGGKLFSVGLAATFAFIQGASSSPPVPTTIPMGGSFTEINQTLIIEDTTPPDILVTGNVAIEVPHGIGSHYTLESKDRIPAPLVFDVADPFPDLLYNTTKIDDDPELFIELLTDSLTGTFPINETTRIAWKAIDFSKNTSEEVYQLVTIKTINSNEASIPEGGSLTILSDNPTILTLNATNPDDDPVEFFIADNPDDGIIESPIEAVFQNKFQIQGTISRLKGITEVSQNIIFADSENSRIMKMSKEGVLSPYFDTTGISSRPEAVAHVSDNTFYISEWDESAIHKVENIAALAEPVEGIDVSDLFKDPKNISYKNGIIYVTDKEGGTITKLIGFPIFDEPIGIANGTSNNILVSDIGSDRIFNFTNDGRFVSIFGGSGNAPGLFDQPSSIAVNSSRILVTDTNNDRVQVFDKSGVFLSEFGSSGPNNGEFIKPWGIVLNDTQIFVTDSENDRIQIFNSAAEHLLTIGSNGNLDGKFDTPLGIAVNASEIFIADSQNHRIQKINLAKPFVSEDYQSNLDWTVTGSGVSINGNAPGNPPGKLNFTNVETGTSATEHGAKKTISKILNNAWTAEFDLLTGINTIDSSGFIWMLTNDTDKHPSNDDTIDVLSVYLNSNQLKIFTEHAGVNSTVGGITLNDDTQYFVKFERQAPTQAKLSVFSDMQRTTHVTGSPLKHETIDSGLSGLNVLQHSNDFSSGGDPLNLVIDNSTIGHIKYSWLGSCESGLNCNTFTSSSKGFMCTEDTCERSINPASSQVGHFNNPQGLTINQTHIFVGDSSNNRIQIFNATGSFKQTIGTEGTGDGEFLTPINVAINSLGNFFVTGKFNDSIQKFNSSGIFIEDWSNSLQTRFPGFMKQILLSIPDLMADGIDEVPGVKIFVADFTEDEEKIFIVPIQGGNITEFDVSELFVKPRKIALDSLNVIHVTDSQDKSISKISDTTGLLLPGKINLQNIGGNGIFPDGIDIDVTDKIYVSDKNQSAIFTLNSAGTAILDTFNATGIFSNQTDNSIDISQDADHFYIADDDSDGVKIIKIRKDKGVTGTILNHGNVDDLKGIEFGVGMSTGKILVANATEQTIRKITPNGVTEQIIDLSLVGIIPDSIAPNVMTTGLKGSFVAPESGDLSAPVGLTFGPEDILYVSSGNTDSIKKYDGTTGEYLGDLTLDGDNGGLEGPWSLVFDDNDLYVSSHLTDSVKRYDGTTGAYLDDALATNTNGLGKPTGLALDSKKNLYVSNNEEDNIIILNKTTGLTSFFVETASNLVKRPNALAVDQNDNLYVSSSGSNVVQKFDKNRVLQQTYSDELLEQPTGIALDISNNLLYVVSNTSPLTSILVFDLTSGMKLDTILENLALPSDIILGKNSNDIFLANTGNSDVLQLGKSPVSIWVADWQTDGKKRLVGLKEDGSVPDPEVIFDLSSVLSKGGHIATDSLARIYVTDTDSSEILVLNGLTGNLNDLKIIDLSSIQISEAIEEFDDEKDSPTVGEFVTVQEAKNISIKPLGLAIDEDDRLYVSDWENNRIVKLDFDGIFEDLFKVNSTFGDPRDIAIPHDPGIKTIYVSDAATEDIVKIQSDLLLEEIRVPTVTTLGGLVKRTNSFLLTDKTTGGLFDFSTDAIAIPKIFTQPEGIDVVDTDIYVTDWDEQRFIKLNAQGVYQDEQVFEDNRFRDYKFLRDIEVDSENIWISDAREARIQKIKLTDPTNDVAPPLLPSDKFLFMSSLAVDSKDNLYVTSTENKTLNKYTQRGTLLDKLDIHGTLEDVYSSLNQDDKKDYIYVGTTDPEKILRLDSSLGIIRNNTFPLNMPLTLAADSTGFVYSAEHTKQITKYNADLSSASTFEIPEASAIYDIFIDSKNSLYAADSGNNKVHKYNLTTGSQIGWLGYCDRGENCDVNDFHSDGFTCTNATCFTDNPPVQPLSFGQFNNPYRLTVDPEQNLYVIDKVYNNQLPYERIQKFSDKGFFIENFYSNSSDTTIKGNFDGAKGIGRGSNFFYVIDIEKIHFYDVNPFSPVLSDQINKMVSANVTLKANSNFVGSDFFRFKVSDGFPPEISSVLIDITVDPSDADNDGIFDDIDTKPGEKSNRFNDGKTSGLVVDYKNQVVLIRNAQESSKGVFIQSDALNDDGVDTRPIFAGCNNATSFELSPFDRVFLTCNNPTIEVIRGNIENVNFTDAAGRVAQIDLKIGDKVSFDPDIFTFHSELALTASTINLNFNEVDSQYALPLLGDVQVDTTSPPIQNVCPKSIVLEAEIISGIDKTDPNTVALTTINQFLNREVTDIDNGNPQQPEQVREIITLKNDAPDILPINVTLVNFTAIDLKGNIGTCQQEIEVRDTTEPEIRPALPLIMVDTDPNNDIATVNFDKGEIFDLPLAATKDKKRLNVTGTVNPKLPDCIPLEGSEFTIGTTNVVCTGVDDAIGGNVGNEVFQVQVNPNPDKISIDRVIAFDSISNPKLGLSDGDHILVKFTHNTNQPPASTKAQIDSLLTVTGGALGTDYIGFYRNPAELILTITDSSPPVPTPGTTKFSINPAANLRSSSGLLSSSLSETTLEGDFSKPSVPYIRSFIAHDPLFEAISGTTSEEQRSNIDFSAGDVMTFKFSQTTNQGGFGDEILDKTKIDSLVTFSNPFEAGDDYIGQWLDSRTLVITVKETNTYTEKIPVIGVTKVSVNIGANLKNLAGTSDASTSESPPLSGGFSNFLSLRTVQPNGAATTILPSGNIISLKIPPGAQTVSISTIDDSEFTSSISFLGNLVNIESVNLDANNEIIDDNSCEDGCDLTFVFSDEDLTRASTKLKTLRIFHDLNGDGKFGGKEALRPTIIETEVGVYTATVKIYSLSSIGAGSVIKSTGGSSSGAAPTVKTVSIFGAKTQQEDGTFGFGGILNQEINLVNSMPTAIIETGNNVKIKLLLENKGGIYSLEHLSMYTNLRGSENEIRESDTYVRYIKGLPVSVVDPHSYFAKADVSLFPIGDTIQVEFDLTFAKPMKLSDLIFRTWDTSLHSRDVTFLEAIEVIGTTTTDIDTSFGDYSTLIGVKPGVMEPEDPFAVELIPKDLIEKWAGFSSESISDSELLDTIGIKGDKIPNWFKSKAAEWIHLEKISQEEFVSALKFFDSIGALG